MDFGPLYAPPSSLFSMRLLLLGAVSILAVVASAQYFPPSPPEGVAFFNSKLYDGVTISYKEVCFDKKKKKKDAEKRIDKTLS
jgi:hypothetical protein